MFEGKKLQKKTVGELKEIAKERKIKYGTKDKKEKIIKLILESQKVNETIDEKKKELNHAPVSSQTTFQPIEKENFFNETPNIPHIYGKNKLIFLVRDPYWGFVYWEINQSLFDEHNLGNREKFLRIYDISGTGNPDSPDSYFDIKLTDEANNWYIKFPQSNRTFIIDYGYFKDGVFYTLLRSNVASTPRDDVSDQLDQEWMLSDEVLRASGANQLFEQSGSQELMKFLAGNISENISSGNVSSRVGSSFLK